MADLDALQQRFRDVAAALAEPAVSPAPAPLNVAVVEMPARRWVFVVQRDDEGRIQSVVAEPLT